MNLKPANPVTHENTLWYQIPFEYQNFFSKVWYIEEVNPKLGFIVPGYQFTIGYYILSKSAEIPEMPESNCSLFRFLKENGHYAIYDAYTNRVLHENSRVESLDDLDLDPLWVASATTHVELQKIAKYIIKLCNTLCSISDSVVFTKRPYEYQDAMSPSGNYIEMKFGEYKFEIKSGTNVYRKVNEILGLLKTDQIKDRDIMRTTDLVPIFIKPDLKLEIPEDIVECRKTMNKLAIQAKAAKATWEKATTDWINGLTGED